MRFTKREVTSGSGESSLFLKLKSGDKVNVVFKGEIYSFFRIFGDNQAYDHKVSGSSERHKASVVLFEPNKPPTAKIFEFGNTVYNDLAKISQTLAGMRPELSDEEKAKLIETVLISISRVGAAKDDTKWSVEFHAPLTGPQLKDLAGVVLPSLKSKPKQEEGPPMPTHDDMPNFSDDPPMDEFF